MIFPLKGKHCHIIQTRLNIITVQILKLGIRIFSIKGWFKGQAIELHSQITPQFSTFSDKLHCPYITKENVNAVMTRHSIHPLVPLLY